MRLDLTPVLGQVWNLALPFFTVLIPAVIGSVVLARTVHLALRTRGWGGWSPVVGFLTFVITFVIPFLTVWILMKIVGTSGLERW